MAVDCQACGEPVHEHVVRCPHCGEATGVAPDPEAATEARAIAALPPPPPARPPPPLAVLSDAERFDFVDPLDALISGVVAVVAERAADHEVSLPRAIARERRSADPAPAQPAVEASEPEAVAPTPPGEEPRFLK